MRHLLAYHYRCHVRSYRYAAPLSLFLLALLFIYAQVPNPVMGSYAFSSSLLFLIMIWVCIGVMEGEEANQDMILSLQAGSFLRLFASKLLYAWFFSLPLAAFAVLYPALFHKFARAPELSELAFSFGSHMVMSVLGVGLASLFNSRLIASRSISYLLLLAAIALSFSGQGIRDKLPMPANSLAWLSPPAWSMVRTLTQYDGAALAARIAALAYPLLYGAVAAALAGQLMNRRKLDLPAK
ncbi:MULTISPECIES: hypothetical protein [unclassified Paenibacillus]|uniref:hypothetical protein n=1 Tax=unclassified Paenibacillus TaxID=185978 RepID=UPI000954835A|nr:MULTISPECIES: hypothetical protein [unclassified Paenibacillus]ASS65319.1 hypothetical protein CIC07_03685 [Paenibacillus sp. RUD330]SIQ40071.1 hypothetical protein SAMN05880555_1627 [Paenibacillus sp. RU4X]SIQ62235.1 hypothetical protein SAMN05880570_1625 [Paenibacillus sp. RU4T]